MDNQDKKKFIPGSKVKISTIVIISVLLAVLLALSSFGLAVFSSQPFQLKDGKVNVYEIKSKLYTKAIVKALPNKITGNDGGKKIDFYIEENDDYDSKNDQPIEQFRVYYYKDGKKLVASEGIYRGDYETMYPLIGFFIQGMNNLKVLKGVFLAIIIAVCIAIVALLIWLIVLLNRIKEDRQYSPSYQEQKLIKEAKKKEEKEKKK